MGIFKKTKPQEIPIKSGISDSEREAERLRQLEASLDFLREKKPSVPPKNAVSAIHPAVVSDEPAVTSGEPVSASGDSKPTNGKAEATHGNPAEPVQNENENRNADQNLPDTQNSKEAGKEHNIMSVSEEGTCSHAHDERRMANMNEVHDITNENDNKAADLTEKNATTVNPKNDVGRIDSFQNNNGFVTILQESVVPEESNTVLSQKEAEETEADRQRAIRNKYGRRMDYKTAKVSTAGVVPAENNTASSKNNGGVAAESRAEEPVCSDKMTIDNSAAENTGHKKQEQETKNITDVKESKTQNETINAKPVETGAGKQADTLGKETAMPIQNPLPTPAKHAHREMEFDVVPSPEDMHFDVVDLSGIDFFDIN